MYWSLFHYIMASPIAQLAKNPTAVQETPVQFLGQEDPLEKGMATHSGIPAWRIPGTADSRLLCPWDLPSKNWSRLPFLSQRDLPNPGFKPTSPPLVGGFFTTELPGKPRYYFKCYYFLFGTKVLLLLLLSHFSCVRFCGTP